MPPPVALRVHPLAVEKDEEFRAASETAREALQGDNATLAQRQQAFVAASANKPARDASEAARPRMPWTPQGAALDAMRATHAKACALD